MEKNEKDEGSAIDRRNFLRLAAGTAASAALPANASQTIPTLAELGYSITKGYALPLQTSTARRLMADVLGRDPAQGERVDSIIRGIVTQRSKERIHRTAEWSMTNEPLAAAELRNIMLYDILQRAGMTAPDIYERRVGKHAPDMDAETRSGLVQFLNGKDVARYEQLVVKIKYRHDINTIDALFDTLEDEGIYGWLQEKFPSHPVFDEGELHLCRCDESMMQFLADALKSPSSRLHHAFMETLDEFIEMDLEDFEAILRRRQAAKAENSKQRKQPEEREAVTHILGLIDGVGEQLMSQLQVLAGRTDVTQPTAAGSSGNPLPGDTGSPDDRMPDGDAGGS